WGAKRGADLRGAQSELRELVVGELHVDLLVLSADQVHLLDMRNPKQPLASHLDIVPGLRIAETFEAERQHARIRVAKLVVEEGTNRARGQRVADVRDLLAGEVPESGNLGRHNVLTWRDEDHRLPALRVAAEVV